MKTTTRVFQMVLLWAMLTPISIFSQNCATEVGSVSVDRPRANCYTLDGVCLTYTESKLETSANFGTGGTVDYPITVSHEVGTLDLAILSGYDVFFIGYLPDGIFSAAELQAMYDFVDGGGRMLVTADESRYDQVADYFGHPTTFQGPVQNFPVAGQENHPVFDGPFGTITTYNAAQTRGYFTATAGATILARDAAGEPTLLEKVIGSGRIILSSDVCVFGNTGTSGTGITNNNDILMANTFAYLAQSPDPLTVDAGSCQTVYYGYAPTECATLTATVSGGEAPYTYTWSNGETTASITVCPTETTSYTVDVVDANGCDASASSTVGVVDVRCGKKMDKVELCHNGNSICVSGASVPAHLDNHGDPLGACGEADPCAPGGLVSHDHGKAHLHEAEVSVWPNPIRDQLHIEVDLMDEIPTIIELISSDGKILFSTTTTFSDRFNIDMAVMPNGLYIVRSQNEVSTQLIRVTK